MLTTTKDSYPAPATVQEPESSSNSGDAGDSSQAQRRTDAIGAEIPVVVHASRYSSASLGVGKNSPPVHEETRTVIVFPNGAVVRISANMAMGELVVLTNQQTGADVICKVVNVKAQPGIQNYVNLEFTQRAAGFWDASVPAEKSSRRESVSSMPAATPAAAAETRLPLAQAGPPRTVPLAPATPAADLSFAPAFAPGSAPSSGAPAEERDGSAVLSGSLLGTDSTAGRTYTPSIDAARMQNWARLGDAEGRTNKPGGSKKILLIAGSAVLLLSLGAAGGFWLFRSVRSSAPTSQAAPNSQEESVPLPAVTTDQDAALPQQNTAPESGTLQTVVASSTNGQPEALVAQPAASKPPSEEADRRAIGQTQNAPVAQPARNANIAAGKLSAPLAKSRAAGDSLDAPPVLSGQSSGLADASAIGSGVYGETPRINAPAVPVRAGGQLQPAKALSSPAPAYPPQASSLHIEGVVTIDAELDDTGKVVRMKVISGPPQLQQAAMDALRQWKYQSAMLDGRAIGSHTEVSLSFHLRQ